MILTDDVEKLERLDVRLEDGVGGAPADLQLTCAPSPSQSSRCIKAPDPSDDEMHWLPYPFTLKEQPDPRVAPSLEQALQDMIH